jgi:hypothetical protein
MNLTVNVTKKFKEFNHPAREGAYIQTIHGRYSIHSILSPSHEHILPSSFILINFTLLSLPSFSPR